MAEWKPMPDDEVARQFAEAQAAGARAESAEPRAVHAHYHAPTGRVHVELSNGCLFAFPAEAGQGLRGATPAQLAEVEVLPGGYGLHWEALDADLAVPALLQGVFGSAAWMREWGRAAGSVRSAAKTDAARANGRKGGRPRRDVTLRQTGAAGRAARVREERAPYGADAPTPADAPEE